MLNKPSGPGKSQSLGAGDEDSTGNSSGFGKMQRSCVRGAEPEAEDGDGPAGTCTSTIKLDPGTLKIKNECP